jgi:ABC-type glycerol-3-phosphate transport system substrate-binding protein
MLAVNVFHPAHESLIMPHALRQPRRLRRPARSILLIATLATIGSCLGACESSEPEPDANARVVTVWAHQGQPRERDAMERIVAAFNEAHADLDLRIKITFFPDRQYADKVSIASASGSLPDVLDIDGPFVGPWSAEEILQPFDDLVPPSLRDDMLDSLVEQGTFDDQLYALGAFDSALVVYYNREMTDAAGLNPPAIVDEAWTWDEFVDALVAVRPYGAVPLSLHMDEQSDEWFTYAFSPLIWSNGGRLIDTNNHQVVGVLNGPRSIRAIERWKSLFENGLAEATTTRPDPFSDGLAAFDWTGHWMLPQFEADDDLRFGVMPLPRMGDEPVAPSGSWCWGISRACDDRDAAWQVIKWFLHPEHGIKPIVEANGAVPGRRSAFELFPEYDEMPRNLFREQLIEIAHPRPRTPVYFTLTSEFARALRDISLGADVESRLTQAAESVQRALDRHAPASDDR